MRIDARPTLLALAVAATLPALARGQGSVLVGMYPSGAAAPLGGQAVVPIAVDMSGSGAALGSYQIQLTWNPAVLKYVSVSPGAFGAPTVNAAGAAGGALTLAGANPAGGTGVVTLANVTLEMLADTGSSPVSVASADLTAAITLAPLTATAVPGRFCANTGKYGDVNRDGSILSNDALYVVTAAVGLPIAPVTLLNADVDNNGKADTRDALIILSAAVGLQTPGFRVGSDNTGVCAVAPAASLAISPSVADLAPGDVLALGVTALSGSGQLVAPPGLAWTSSRPAGVDVDTAGQVTAFANGPATITARALGGPTATATMNVADRHVWYVDAVKAATTSAELGSTAYPFATIQRALDKAGGGDSVRVAVDSAPYPGAQISKPVVLLGDSSAAGMPTITNAAGPAITSNTLGRAVIQRFNLVQSSEGLNAQGDTIELQSVAAANLRGTAFRIHKMRRAQLTGVSGVSLALAGLFADSTPVVVLNQVSFKIIEQRGDSVAGVAVLGGNTLSASQLSVFGVVADGDRPALTVFGVKRVVVNGFDVRFAGGVRVDSANFVSLAAGVERGGNRTGVRVTADTVQLDTLDLRQVSNGISIGPRDPTAHNPAALAIVTRSIVDSATGDAVSVQGIGSLRIRGGHVRAALGAGVSAAGVDTVSLVGLEVDGSAVPTTLGPTFAVSVRQADSVRLDSLNLHDNIGGGISLSATRVFRGLGGSVVRNQGLTISCGIDCLPQPVPGIAILGVRATDLAHFAVSSNGGGGVSFGTDTVTRASLVVDTAALVGPGTLLAALGPCCGTGTAAITVNGGTFRSGVSGIAASYLASLTVRGATFDSTPAPTSSGSRTISTNAVDTVRLVGDSIFRGTGSALEVQGATSATVDSTLVRAQTGSSFVAFTPEAAIGVNTTVTASVTASRLEPRGQLRGIRLDAGLAGPVIVDGAAISGDSTDVGIVAQSPVTVRNSRIAGNLVGVDVLAGGEATQVHYSNFIQNSLAGLRNQTLTLVAADTNYWNDPHGPRCGIGAVQVCDSLSIVGDVVEGPVTFIPFLTAPAGGAPASAPPVRARAAPLLRPRPGGAP